MGAMLMELDRIVANQSGDEHVQTEDRPSAPTEAPAEPPIGKDLEAELFAYLSA